MSTFVLASGMCCELCFIGSKEFNAHLRVHQVIRNISLRFSWKLVRETMNFGVSIVGVGSQFTKGFDVFLELSE